jgi:hypothetical protein
MPRMRRFEDGVGILDYNGVLQGELSDRGSNAYIFDHQTVERECDSDKDDWAIVLYEFEF